MYKWVGRMMEWVDRTHWWVAGCGWLVTVGGCKQACVKDVNWCGVRADHGPCE